MNVLLFFLSGLEDLWNGRLTVGALPECLPYSVTFTYLERTQETFVYAHHSSGIVKFSAVVGCAEKCDELAFREEFVTILDNLMGTADQIHVVLLQETRDYIRAERERYTTIVLAPASNVLIRVGPQQIAKKTAVGNLDKSVSRCQTETCGNLKQRIRKAYVCWPHNTANLFH